VQYAIATGGGAVVDVHDLPPELRPEGGADEAGERARIARALEEARWSRERAAELLGMSRTTLWRKMRRLGL
jgi:two-component system response regulator HydG